MLDIVMKDRAGLAVLGKERAEREKKKDIQSLSKKARRKGCQFGQTKLRYILY